MTDDLRHFSPRVEACIEGVMKKHHGESKAAMARYFEEVHQHLAPLARQLESELAQAKAGQAEAWKQLAELKGRLGAADQAVAAPAAASDHAVLAHSAQATQGSAVCWEYCPECGSYETREPKEGDEGHYFCAGCGHEWYGHIDYTDVVRGHLAKRTANNPLPPGAPVLAKCCNKTVPRPCTGCPHVATPEPQPRGWLAGDTSAAIDAARKPFQQMQTAPIAQRAPAAPAHTEPGHTSNED